MFFSTDEMSIDDFNQTELRSRKAGSNALEIELSFDVMNVKSDAKYIREIKSRVKNSNGVLNVIKRAFYREASGLVDWEILARLDDDQGSDYFEIDSFVDAFLGRFSVSYLHPQEVDRLLREAQEKLKIRLLSKFGRGAARFVALEGLEHSWSEMREEANRDLSANLTMELRKVWPESSAIVELPQTIDEIVAISEIKFKGYDSLPEVSLSGQGNGVQSAVLYQTHYLLDSDKTIHRGLYFPIWLVEEPESFLHADITYKIGRLLVSAEWLGVVQMIVTTHSPLILAASSSTLCNVRWSLLDGGALKFSKEIGALDQGDFHEVGSCLGDSNFEVYFNASSAGDILLIEDSRPLTKQVLVNSGIPVSKSLNGSGELKKYVDTLRFIDLDISSDVVFLLDNDKGAREFRTLLIEEARVKVAGGFSLYKIKDYLWIILFPEDMAVEDLFDEYDGFLGKCAFELYDFNEDMTEGVATTSRGIPASLSRAHAEIRGRAKVHSHAEAKRQIAKCQDVKDVFWREVAHESYEIAAGHVANVMQLLDGIGWESVSEG